VRPLLPRSVSGDRLCRLVGERTGDNRSRATDARVVSAVLPFKVSSYVVDELIDWDKAPDDPIYRLTFSAPRHARDRALRVGRGGPS